MRRPLSPRQSRDGKSSRVAVGGSELPPTHGARPPSFFSAPRSARRRCAAVPLLALAGMLLLLAGLVTYSATAVPAGRTVTRLVKAVEGSSKGLSRVVGLYTTTTAVTVAFSVAVLALAAASHTARARLRASLAAAVAAPPRGAPPGRAAHRSLAALALAAVLAAFALAAWCLLLTAAHVSAALAMESAIRGTTQALGTLNAAVSAADRARDVGGGIAKNLDAALRSAPQPAEPGLPLPPGDPAPAAAAALDAAAAAPAAATGAKDLIDRLSPGAARLGAAARRALGPDPAAAGAADGAADGAALDAFTGVLAKLGLIDTAAGAGGGAAAAAAAPPPPARRLLAASTAPAPAATTNLGPDLLGALASLQPSRQDVLTAAAGASRAVETARRSLGAPSGAYGDGAICPSVACLDVRIFPAIASDACVCSEGDLETVRALALEARGLLRASLAGIACMQLGALILLVRLTAEREGVRHQALLLFTDDLAPVAAVGRDVRARRRASRSRASPGPGSRGPSGNGGAGRPPLPCAGRSGGVGVGATVPVWPTALC